MNVMIMLNLAKWNFMVLGIMLRMLVLILGASAMKMKIVVTGQKMVMIVLIGSVKPMLIFHVHLQNQKILIVIMNVVIMLNLAEENSMVHGMMLRIVAWILDAFVTKMVTIVAGKTMVMIVLMRSVKAIMNFHVVLQNQKA